MNESIDPKKFGLPARTVLEQIASNVIAIVMQRKSRIIMADGKKIVEKARKIQDVLPDVIVVLKTYAPVCGKTVFFLEREGVEVTPLSE
jgi:hypothetical protein